MAAKLAADTGPSTNTSGCIIFRRRKAHDGRDSPWYQSDAFGLGALRLNPTTKTAAVRSMKIPLAMITPNLSL
jgi:hypothetical protein